MSRRPARRIEPSFGASGVLKYDIGKFQRSKDGFLFATRARPVPDTCQTQSELAPSEATELRGLNALKRSGNVAKPASGADHRTCGLGVTTLGTSILRMSDASDSHRSADEVGQK